MEIMPNAYSNQALRGKPKPQRGMAIGMPINTKYGHGRIVNIQQALATGNLHFQYCPALDSMLITVLITDTQEVISGVVSGNFFSGGAIIL